MSSEFTLDNLPAGSISPIGLKLPPMEYEEWRNVGLRLGRIGRSMAWFIGDWLNFGERYGEKYSQAASETHYDPGYLANVAWICRTFEHSRRREALSFRHHQVVAGLKPPEQDRWLLLAEEKKWTSEDLAERIKDKKKKGKEGGGDDPPELDEAAEWLRLTLKLCAPDDRKDVQKALAKGLKVYGVKTHAQVVAHWAVEALARWKKEKA